MKSKYLARAFAVATVALFAPSVAHAGVYVCNAWTKECVHFPDHSVGECGYGFEPGGGQWVCFPDGALSAAPGAHGPRYVTLTGKRMRVIAPSGGMRRKLEAILRQPKTARSRRAFQAAVAEALPSRVTEKPDGTTCTGGRKPCKPGPRKPVFRK